MALSTLEKKTVGCKSSYDWLVSLAMDLVALCDMWGCNGINRCHLAVFSVYMAFGSSPPLL